MNSSTDSLFVLRHSFAVYFLLAAIVLLCLSSLQVEGGRIISDKYPNPFNPALRTFLDFEIDRKKFLYKKWLDRIADEYNEDVEFQIMDLEQRIPEHRSSFVDTPLIPPGAPTVITLRVPTEKEIEYRQRYAVLYVPSSSSVADSLSLLLLFHNLEGNCLDFTLTARVTEYADRDNMVIASLCGSMGRFGIGWNAGTCCGFDGEEPNEEQFTRALVNLLVDAIPQIDPTKVAVLGLENGALLSQTLLCQAPDLIRAVISLGGVTTMTPGMGKGLEECDLSTQKRRQADNASWGAHLLLIHSDTDTHVPWKGRSKNGFPSVDDNLEAWVKREGCDVEGGDTTMDDEKAENLVFSSCDVESMNYTQDLSFIQAEEDMAKVHTFRALRESGEVTGDEAALQMHPRMKASLESDPSKYAKPTVELVRLKGHAGYLNCKSIKDFDSIEYAFEFLQRALGGSQKFRALSGSRKLPPRNWNVTIEEINRRQRVTERQRQKMRHR